jgi:GDSL-like Lipase/Acylhydrolase family
MHVVLLGDSIFDNARYVPGEASVTEQLRPLLPNGAETTLIAVDGSVTLEVAAQVARLPPDATHLIVSSGGNDALHASLMVEQSAAVLTMLTDIQRDFRGNYRRLVATLQKVGKPTVICTIYDSIPHLEREKMAALSIFNDVIVSEASRAGFPVLDLRALCNESADYSALSPIEPSAKGGMKIARRIALVLKQYDFKSSRTILF